MRSPALLALVLAGALATHAQAPATHAGALPVRGLHLSAPAKAELPRALTFIQQTLPKLGVNTLILEFDYNFDFKSRPEFAAPAALGAEEAGQLAKACRAAGIELIPQINCLGHQSWAAHTDRLLALHPEFDETPGKYPDNKGIYCRSYCPLHPDVHPVLFALMDELAKACAAKSFHVGMDEVFILADADCPRCKGKSTAEVFAGEVTRLDEHLRKIGCRMWMWGDRFLDGKATGTGEWEGSQNGTFAAVDRVPKDLVICDWHYDKAPETVRFFVSKGFPVVASPWRKSNVALDQLAQVRSLRQAPASPGAGQALGVVQTTWCGFAPFLRAFEAKAGGAAPTKNEAGESSQCFRTLFQALEVKP
jgi:hypothetical protein